jgi:hypothetical protein
MKKRGPSAQRRKDKRRSLLILQVEPGIDVALVCLQCGDMMWGQGCKIRCDRCGYFVSCSEFL